MVMTISLCCLYELIAAWICSRVFPFVSGTTPMTNTMPIALIAAYRIKVPAKWEEKQIVNHPLNRQVGLKSPEMELSQRICLRQLCLKVVLVLDINLIFIEKHVLLLSSNRDAAESYCVTPK